MKSATVLKKIAAYESKYERKFTPQYKSRKQEFGGASWGFSPVTGQGHSYSWYQLTKVINGKLILNTHYYSPTTGKHVGKVHSILRMLGMKALEIEAPKGLQDLDIALAHCTDLLGSALIENKYARIKSTYQIKRAEKMLAVLKLLGKRSTKAMLVVAIEHAETFRRERLDRQRTKREASRPRVGSAA